MSITVLGIDCSSTTIGWCALEIDNDKITLKKCGYIKPIKEGSIIEKIVDTRVKVIKLINDIKPDYVGVEDIIQFIKGKSTANTVITLTTFNRMVCLLAYDYLNKLPELFSVMAIRHGLKMNGIFPKKEDMPELVAKHLGIKFPYEYIVKGKSKGKIKEESYDIADGFAVALYYSLILTNKIKVKKVKVKVKKKKVKKDATK